MQKLYGQKVNALRKLSSLEDKYLRAFSALCGNKMTSLSNLLSAEVDKAEDNWSKYLCRIKLEGYLDDEQETLLFNLVEIKKALVMETVGKMED